MKKGILYTFSLCLLLFIFLNSCEKKDIEVLKINVLAGTHEVDLNSSGPGEYRAEATSIKGVKETAYFRIVNTVLTDRVRNENFDNVNNTQILYSKINENDSLSLMKTVSVNMQNLICFEYEQFLVEEAVTFMVSEKCEVVFYKD